MGDLLIQSFVYLSMDSRILGYKPILLLIKLLQLSPWGTISVGSCIPYYSLYPFVISPLLWGFFLALWDFLPLKDAPRIYIFTRLQHILKSKIYCFQPSKPEVSKWPGYWWMWDKVILKKLIGLLVSSTSLSIYSITSITKACTKKLLFKPSQESRTYLGRIIPKESFQGAAGLLSHRHKSGWGQPLPWVSPVPVREDLEPSRLLLWDFLVTSMRGKVRTDLWTANPVAGCRLGQSHPLGRGCVREQWDYGWIRAVGMGREGLWVCLGHQKCVCVCVHVDLHTCKEKFLPPTFVTVIWPFIPGLDWEPVAAEWVRCVDTSNLWVYV